MAEANGVSKAPSYGNTKYSVVQPRNGATKKREACKISLLKILGVLVLIALFLFALTGSVILWCTDLFNSMVIENLVLKNNTQTFEWWQRPPVEPYMRVHVFNYTNMEAFMHGEKPKVQEVGPYTFRQKMEKVNVVFDDNGTVSYREKIAFEFVPELSVSDGKDDRVTVLNMPLLSAISIMRNEGMMKRFIMASTIKALGSKPYLNLSANDFMWGYKEALTTLASVFQSINVDPESLKLGIMEARDGINPSTVTVETGAREIDRLGIITRVNGKNRLDAWGDTDCSRMDGSDGTMFPPRLVQRKERLHLFNKDMCRRLPLEFKKEVEIKGGIPAYRYGPPDNVFGAPDTNPDNKCFCPGGEKLTEDCPLGGVFSVGPCTFGAPVLVSFPHFYLGDDALFKNVEGLQPNETKHAMYLNLHPKLGIPMGGQSRFQFNIQIHKTDSLSLDDFLIEDSILPIVWFEIGVDELPPELQDVFYRATFTTLSYEMALKYGLLAITIVALLILLRCACRRFVTQRNQPVDRSDKLVMEPL
ncbi:lysosome membrane protein 2 isoform X2 [Anabrus simplex]|uniref:lysosome membrane protein 2 isoform X2 n=1 Tax=Anabrus simplex TaxID=316456 RepID=UPI0035A31E6B